MGDPKRTRAFPSCSHWWFHLFESEGEKTHPASILPHCFSFCPPPPDFGDFQCPLVCAYMWKGSNPNLVPRDLLCDLGKSLSLSGPQSHTCNGRVSKIYIVQLGSAQVSGGLSPAFPRPPSPGHIPLLTCPGTGDGGAAVGPSPKEN